MWSGQAGAVLGWICWVDVGGVLPRSGPPGRVQAIGGFLRTAIIFDGRCTWIVGFRCATPVDWCRVNIPRLGLAAEHRHPYRPPRVFLSYGFN